MDALAKPAAVEIRIGNVDLVTKLDAIGAALAAVREAHRCEMPIGCWIELHHAQAAIAAAILARNYARTL